MKIILLEPEEPDQATAQIIERIYDLLVLDSHEILRQRPGKSLYEKIMNFSPDVVFNIAGINNGSQAKLIPAVFEITGVRYTGPGILSFTLTHNYTKLFPLLAAIGINLLPYKVFLKGYLEDLDDLHPPLALRIDGQQGGLVFPDKEAAVSAIKELPANKDALLQEVREGQRASCYLLEEKFFLSIDEDRIKQAALKAYQLLEARGLVRFDFVDCGGWYLNGIDPCPNPLDEGLLKMAAENGWSEIQWLKILIENAASDLKPLPQAVNDRIRISH